MAGSRRVKLSKMVTGGEGSKDHKTLHKECAMPRTLGLEGYWSTMDQEDLSLIYVGYCMPKDFVLELPGLEARVDNRLPSRLGIYKESFKVGLRFPLFLLLILKFLRYYRIPQCILTHNSIRLVMVFLAIRFLVKVV